MNYVILVNFFLIAVNIIKSIRNNIKIKRVVYVACEALAARQNFIE